MRIRNPRTGACDYEIATLDADAVESVAATLRAKQVSWASADRTAALHQLADAIERHADAITAALMLDTGRSAISRIEVTGTIRLIRRWADSAASIIAQHRINGAATAIAGITTSTRLIAYPLVGVISPWNFPLTLALIDAIPALAAGCAVIVKPSEVTPRFIRPLMAAIAEAKVPIVVIEGDGATGAALVYAVDYIAFTGSVATGRKVAVAAADAFIPASLELGGKDPMIVLATADPERAAAIALRAAIVNSGQACQSIERVYVAREIAAPFIAALVDAANRVRLNDRDIDVGDIGPFILAAQADIVQAQIDDAVAHGATVLSGGAVETLGGGRYLRPTVITGVAPAMALMREETFGPVIPVTVFDHVDEAIALANDSMFGLSAAVIGNDAERVATRLNAGAVSINDGALTSMVWEAEKSSFGMSGLGPSRMGTSGLMRFFRRQALIEQTGIALTIAAYAEDSAR